MSRHAAMQQEDQPFKFAGITRVVAELDEQNHQMKKPLLKALDLVLPFVATRRVRFFESGDYTAYTATSDDTSRTIRMQAARSTASSEGVTRHGVWYGHEDRRDVTGSTWTRWLGDHVCDDFGMLVPVPPMRSFNGAQS
jgi:hypothetical protein